MDDAERGRLVISAAKNLKRYRLADVRIASLLYATSLAGRAGLFLSAIRSAVGASIDRLAALAAEEGINVPELLRTLLPWFEDNGLINIDRDARGDILRASSLVLTYDGLLRKVAELYDSFDPRPEDVGIILLLGSVTQLPRLESEVRQELAAVIGEEKAALAISLAKAYRIVSARAGKGLPEPVLYSEHVWSRNIAKAARALATLKGAQRDVILALVDRVREYPGMPEDLVRADLRAKEAEPLLDLAMGVGLLSPTTIQMAGGSSRRFLISPHFYAGVEAEFGEDMCDRVKIFLDSVRNGQHFGHPWTGRILSPDRLLRKLLNVGEIGPCTAIGTDWITSEKAGIIRVRRDDPSRGECYLELVQKDTVQKVHELLTTGNLVSDAVMMEPGNVNEGVSFRSIEETRAEAGEVPAPIAEAERAIILSLREG